MSPEKLRPVERIDRVLALVARLWHQHPHLRFTQLLVGHLPVRGEADLYFLEDTELEDHLQGLLKESDGE